MDHNFDWDAMRCMDCDCRPWGAWASLPCGTTEQPVALSTEEFMARAAIFTDAVRPH